MQISPLSWFFQNLSFFICNVKNNVPECFRDKGIGRDVVKCPVMSRHILYRPCIWALRFTIQLGKLDLSALSFVLPAELPSLSVMSLSHSL